MRQGSRQRRAARVKRRRKQLAQLLGAQESVAVLAGECSLRETCAGLSKDDRARARDLLNQLQAEATR